MPEGGLARGGGGMAWWWVGPASWVFKSLRVVIAVPAPGFLGHLHSNSDLGVNIKKLNIT